jgi:amino acid permease-like protein
MKHGDSSGEPQGVLYIRRLGLFDAAMVVMGGIIGGGIFLNPSIVAQRAGTATGVVITWVLGGGIALAGALCFAELGSRRPEAGGGYVYLGEAFGPLPAFLYGWTFLFVINAGGIAAIVVTFARYATDLIRLSPFWVAPVAVGAIVVLTAANYLGVRIGAAVQNFFTVLKLAALALLVLAGLALSSDATHGGSVDLIPRQGPDRVWIGSRNGRERRVPGSALSGTAALLRRRLRVCGDQQHRLQSHQRLHRRRSHRTWGARISLAEEERAIAPPSSSGSIRPTQENALAGSRVPGPYGQSGPPVGSRRSCTPGGRTSL